MTTSEIRSRKSLARELLDVRCGALVAPRIVPFVYVGMSACIGYALCALTVWAFHQSSLLGWLHLLVVSPLAFAFGVMFARLVIEVSIAVLEIRSHADELGALPRRVGRWPAMRRIVAFGESRVWSVRDGSER